MHLAQIKELSGKSWTELAEDSGIPRPNLSLIAKGRRGFDPETAFKLRGIGVDLNEQVEVLAKMKGWRRTQQQARRIDQGRAA